MSYGSRCQFQTGFLTLFNTHTHARTPQSRSEKSFIDAAVHRWETLITVYQAGLDASYTGKKGRQREKERSGRVIDDTSAAVKMTNLGS